MLFSQIRQYVKGILANSFINKSTLDKLGENDNGLTFDGNNIEPPQELTSQQMQDIKDAFVIDSPRNGYPVLFDETGAEHFVGWYKYANGTKKPVYEKSFVYNSTITNYSTHVKIADIGDLHVDVLVSLFGATNNHGDNSNIAVPIGYNTEANDARMFYIKKITDPGIYTRGTSVGILSVVMRYTKTTDQPQ